MSEDGERRKDPGDAVREGVRSVIGILGALKDAIEESFEDLRGGSGDTAESAPEATPETAAEGVRSTFQAAQDAVEDVRERLDFVTRKEFDALAAELADLRARVEANAGRAQAPGAAGGQTGSAGTAADDAADAGNFRFDVE